MSVHLNPAFAKGRATAPVGAFGAKRVCAESNLLEQLSIYLRRMTGKLTETGTLPLPGVLGKRVLLRFNL